MIRRVFILLGVLILSESLFAQIQGDLCTNPYLVTLQDPLLATCDYQEITGLDFTNFNDDPFSPSPSCSYGTNNNDIWVRLTIPPNADGFKITMDSSVITSVDNDYQNFKVAVYSGTSCGSLSYKTCKSSSRARVYNNYFDGFSPGDHLYVRIYIDNSPSGTWDKPFFARFTSISTNHSNDACSNASALIPGNYCNHLATDKGENDNKAPDKLTSTTSVCDPGNAEFGSFDNNQWYYFEVTASTPQPVRITISNVFCSAGDKILQAAIWKANSLDCSSWGNGYNLTNPSSALQGDLLSCAVGTGTVTISENLPAGKYWYTIDGSAGSFCQYSITEAPVVSVPIRLINFHAQTTMSEVQLYWSCTGVTPSSYFVIEKSEDGKNFRQEGFVTEQKNKNAQADFSYEVSPAPLYYRIMVMEPGEKAYYSEIIFAGENVSESKIEAYSYGSEGLSLFYSGIENEQVAIKMSNVNAAEIFSENAFQLLPGENKISLSEKNLASGLYFLQIVSENEYYYFKLIVE